MKFNFPIAVIINSVLDDKMKVNLIFKYVSDLNYIQNSAIINLKTELSEVDI